MWTLWHGEESAEKNQTPTSLLYLLLHLSLSLSLHCPFLSSSTLSLPFISLSPQSRIAMALGAPRLHLAPAGATEVTQTQGTAGERGSGWREEEREGGT